MRPSSSSGSSYPQRWLEFRASKGFITSVVAVAVFADVFLYGLIIPVVPFALEGIIGVEKGEVQRWVSIMLAVYGGAALVASPVFGYFADRYRSRRTPFLVGLICLATGTLLFVVGQTLVTLIIARALQGASASAVWVVGLALLVDTFGKDHVGEAMGVIGIAMTGAILSGPVVGGIIFDYAGYTACFVPAICLIVVDIAMRILVIEPKPVNRKLGIPNYGSFTTNKDNKDACNPSSVERLLSPSSLDDGESSESFQTLSTRERPWSKKLPHSLQMLTNPRLSIVLWNSLLFLTMFSGLESTVPLYLMRTFHMSSSQAGITLLALMLPSLLGTLIGKYVDKRGPRLPAALGFLFLSTAFIIMSLPRSFQENLRITVVLLLIIGTGACALDVALMTEVCQAVGEIEEADKESQDGGLLGGKSGLAQAYGLFNTALSAGQMLGPLAGGFIKNAFGWRGMAFGFGLLSALAIIPATLWTGGWIQKRRQTPGASSCSYTRIDETIDDSC